VVELADVRGARNFHYSFGNVPDILQSFRFTLWKHVREVLLKSMRVSLRYLCFILRPLINKKINGAENEKNCDH
jgi:hypothetical protein